MLRASRGARAPIDRHRAPIHHEGVNEAIREISGAELRRDFLALLGELEEGRAFDPSHLPHVEWLEKLVAARELLGARSFAAYAPTGEGLGFVTILCGHGLPGTRWFAHRVEILDLGIIAAQRGHGIGARLLAHSEEAARAGGFQCIIVATYGGSRRAISFYLREGYTPVATLPDVHGPGDEGMVYLRKFLQRNSTER